MWWQPKLCPNSCPSTKYWTWLILLTDVVNLHLKANKILNILLCINKQHTGFLCKLRPPSKNIYVYVCHGLNPPKRGGGGSFVIIKNKFPCSKSCRKYRYQIILLPAINPSNATKPRNIRKVSHHERGHICSSSQFCCTLFGVGESF